MELVRRLVHAALLLLFALGAVANASPPADSVVFVGEFSNMRFTAEHQYGYSVQLWRNGNELIGFLESAGGLAGDTPTGLLEDVRFNAVTGALSFRAKLSVAWESLGKNKFEATHDLFIFNGRIQKERVLSGTLTHVDKLHPDQAATTEHLRLVKLMKTEGGATSEVTSYGEWKQSADEILKFRGPKW